MTTKIEAKENFIIGVISDTHGHVPAAVPKAFNNADLIIHAGDIGDQKVLDQLSKIAPVVAVRGNMDFGKWSRRLPEAEIIKIGQITLYVLHIANRLDADPVKSGFNAVISGHTHRPDIYEQNGVTYLNPGSASYPKFGSPGSAALIHIEQDRFGVKLIRLKN